MGWSGFPSSKIARFFSTRRALMPHPPSQSVHMVATLVTSPLSGDGRHDQFWLQMAVSSVNFHGNGESSVPPTAPAANCKKALLPNFIPFTLASTPFCWEFLSCHVFPTALSSLKKTCKPAKTKKGHKREQEEPNKTLCIPAP